MKLYMKRSTLCYSILYLIIISGIYTTPAYAEGPLNNPAKQSAVEVIRLKNLELKKTNAYKEIDRRITSLNSLKERIVNTIKISTDTKNSLLSQVDQEITKLQSLKTTIAETTDLETLKTHKQSIVSSYRIYALLLPKITILAHADRIQNLVDMMKTRTTDEIALQKLEGASAKTQSAIKMVIDLSPDGYPENKISLQEARKLLEAARIEINSARPLIKPEN